MKPKAIEVFAGAGGLSLGLKRAGFDIILANELEKDFAQTYKANHSSTKVICADIRSVDFKNEIEKLGLQKIDLLSGGPPCQGFSTIGAKKEHDPRNNLFQEYLRAVSETNPNFIIFENVSGFKKLYKGKAFKSIVNGLNELGFNTYESILEASDFGLPQKRERMIIVGWKKEFIDIKRPNPTHSDIHTIFGSMKKLTLIDAISDLPELGANDSKSLYKTEPQNEFQKSARLNSYKLTEHNSSNYGSKMLEILSLIPEGGTIENIPEELRPKNYFKNTYARLHPDKPSPTITRNFGTPSSSRCVHPFQNRALSTREGARLQGFPDNYQFFGSKTSKNLQIGNAVPPILGEVVGKEIIKSISLTKELSKVRSQIFEITD
ncbi:MAG: DNA cytosine methyltransferase [Campylobacterales bacterium]